MSIIAHSILDDTKNWAKQDHSADNVQTVQMPLPGDEISHSCKFRVRSHAIGEHNRGHYEQGECEYLYCQTRKHYVLPHVRHGALRRHASATTLDEEGNDVTADEYLGDPFDAYRRESLSVDTADDACEDHVDCSGKQEGGKKDKDALDNIGY